MDMEKQTQTGPQTQTASQVQTASKAQTGGKFRHLSLLSAGGVALLLAAALLFSGLGGSSQPEVLTVSTLEKIIQVSELSTFTAVYNGVAQVQNEKKPEEADYYVSYEARVYAGLDFEQLELSVDEKSKTVQITLPEIRLISSAVDVTSLEFIFYNSKANTSSVTEAALKACEEDVETEARQQSAIYDLARQNAVNVLTALIDPLVRELDSGYTVSVK